MACYGPTTRKIRQFDRIEPNARAVTVCIVTYDVSVNCLMGSSSLCKVKYSRTVLASMVSLSFFPPCPYLKYLPGTAPLTILPALAPPLIYYLALLFLPPFPNTSSEPTARIIPLLRNSFALLSGLLFFRLPLKYHVPFSIGLTYQLALVGLYGGCRVLDAFFVSPYLFHHIPRRVKYHHAPRKLESGTPLGADAESYFSLHFLTPGQGEAVTETATTDEGWPHGWKDRASWALELEFSMRGAGFTWSSADVRQSFDLQILVHCLLELQDQSQEQDIIEVPRK